MKKIIKKGIEDLPLVYQLAEVQEVQVRKKDSVSKEVRPNRFIKIEKYDADITQAYKSSKPVSKII